jgi:hypothetical protein
VGDNERGPLYQLNDIRHGEGLPRAGNAEQDLMRDAFFNVSCNFFNRFRLVAPWFVVADNPESFHDLLF